VRGSGYTEHYTKRDSTARAFGQVAAVGAAFTQLGWKQAETLAMTSATVGILGSIIGGIVR